MVVDHIRIDRPSVQLTLYIAEPHTADRRSKIDQLMHAAAAAGVAGGTVIAAYQGFGRRHSHDPTFWHRAEETPLTVIFVDLPERLEVLLSVVDEVLPDAVAVTEQVRAIRYLPPHTH